jgi:hypothetical protein
MILISVPTAMRQPWFSHQTWNSIDTLMSNIVYPKSLRLAIYGCGDAADLLLTKAQIEESSYSEKKILLISLLFCVVGTTVATTPTPRSTTINVPTTTGSTAQSSGK